MRRYFRFIHSRYLRSGPAMLRATRPRLDLHRSGGGQHHESSIEVDGRYAPQVKVVTESAVRWTSVSPPPNRKKTQACREAHESMVENVATQQHHTRFKESTGLRHFSTRPGPEAHPGTEVTGLLNGPEMR